MSEAPQGLKIGDRVRLRSGGPLMTVVQVMSNHSLFCKWFDETGNLQGVDFPPATLQVIEGVAK